MKGFFEELKEQRWDDHRFYHNSRVNQTLHLISAMSFCATYVLLFVHPVFAVLFGWTFSMCSRQVGHFFFEPKGYDERNQATHEYKESVKVGYNLRRKVILHSVWGLVPVLLLLSPTMFGIFKQPWTGVSTTCAVMAEKSVMAANITFAKDVTSFMVSSSVRKRISSRTA